MRYQQSIWRPLQDLLRLKSEPPWSEQIVEPTLPGVGVPKMVRHTNDVATKQSGSGARATDDELPEAVRTAACRGAARLARQVALAVGELNLSPSQYRVMAYLAEGDSPASVLAGRLNVTKPSVTALIDGLEEKGLVQRKRSKGDRRMVKAVLTDAGRDALAAADESTRRRLDALAQYLDDGDRAVAVRGLALWNEALNQQLAEVMGQP
jgi:DNA-binding MarR family transcriptional regulator